jgi:hypothetical protein
VLRTFVGEGSYCTENSPMIPGFDYVRCSIAPEVDEDIFGCLRVASMAAGKAPWLCLPKFVPVTYTLSFVVWHPRHISYRELHPLSPYPASSRPAIFLSEIFLPLLALRAFITPLYPTRHSPPKGSVLKSRLLPSSALRKEAP